MVDETGYDGVETSHDYTLLRNEKKINESRKTETKKPEPKKEEPKKEEPGSKPLVTVERDGTVYKEPMV